MKICVTDSPWLPKIPDWANKIWADNSRQEKDRQGLKAEKMSRQRNLGSKRRKKKRGENKRERNGDAQNLPSWQSQDRQTQKQHEN